LAALSTLRCGEGGALIDPPDGFALVADRTPEGDDVRTNISYRKMARLGLQMVHLSFTQEPIDAHELWLSSMEVARLREERRGERLYYVLESESMVNGVPRMDQVRTILFNEDGAGVSLFTMGATLDEALAIADSVKRVSRDEYQAALDKFAAEWVKDVYVVADVVPAGFRVGAYEDKQRAGISLSPPDGGSNYSMEFRSGPDFSATIAGREGRMVTVGDRAVRLVAFDMAAPPANVGDPVTQYVGLRQAIWSENGVTVTLTTQGGPDVEPTLLAIVGGVRIVDETEWKAFLAAHSGPR
jgi:hypothetical protein